jgi:ligand-binding sensor domain-containing protein
MSCKHRLFFLVCCFLLLGVKSQISQSIIIDKINTKDLTNPFVSALFQDQKGYLWVGTIGGLNKYDGYGFTKYRGLPNDSASLSNSAITCFHQTDLDYIYIGTRKGLNIYNYNTNNFKRVFTVGKGSNSTKNNINCIISDKSGEKIVGTGNGVLKYNLKQNKLEPISYDKDSLLEGWSVLCMCIDRLGNLWMGAKKNDPNSQINRVFKFNFSTRQLSEINTLGKESSEHCGISEDYLGNIWVAVSNGLVSVNPGNYKITFYKAPENFYSNVSYSHTKDNTI